VAPRREVSGVLTRTRLLALGGLGVVALLYWKPLHSYEHTRSVLDRRQGQVAQLRAQNEQLQHRLATVGTGDELIREARRLGLVKPGEQLFIVRGIAAWRKHH
jgi:cell division protein FtsB